MPDVVEVVTLPGARPLAQLLVDAALAPSKNEARRLLEQGAVTIDGERASAAAAPLASRAEPYLFKVGKRRFLKIRID